MRKRGVLLFLIFSRLGFGWTHLGSNILGWENKAVTFYVNPTNCTLPESTLNDILDTAINAWNGIPNSGLVVSRSATTVSTTISEFDARTATQVPVIVCDPAMAQADDIPGQTTNTYLDSAGHIIYSGIVLNANTAGDAEISKLTRQELEVTIAHEIGHALGLGHSGDSTALMYFAIGTKSAQITQDDADGIAQIYPKNEFSGGTFGCASVHARHSTQNFYWFWTGLVFILSQVWVGRALLKTKLKSAQPL